MNRCTPAIALLLSIACGSTPEERPSGSDQVAEAPLTLEDSALVTYGLDQERAGYDLSTASDVELLSDGRLAVLCCGSRVLILELDGQLGRSYGSRGDGPDQFQWPRMTRQGGDTLLVWDALRRRASWVTPARGVVRSVRHPLTIPTTYRVPLGATSDGGILLASINSYTEAGVSIVRDTVRSLASVAVAREDQPLEELFTIPDLLLVGRTPPGANNNVLVMDFVRYGGLASVRRTDSTTWTLPGGSHTIEMRRSDRQVRRVELPWGRSAVTQRDRDEVIRRETAPLRQGDPTGHAPPPDPEASLRFIESSPFADSLPWGEGLIPDGSGKGVWVLHGSALNTPWRITRIADDGSLGPTIIATDPATRPRVASDSTVLVSRTDADGVTRFELRRVMRRLAPSH